MESPKSKLVLALVALTAAVFWPAGAAVGAANAASVVLAQQSPPLSRDETQQQFDELRDEIGELRADLSDERAARLEQQDDAQYFFEVVTIIIGVAALIITIGAVLATIAGYQLVRRYVEAEFTRRAGDAFEEHGKPLLEERADAMQAAVETKLAEVDERLAAELDLYRRAKGPQQ